MSINTREQFGHSCIFQDETGKNDTLMQMYSYTTSIYPLNPNIPNPKYMRFCEWWIGRTTIKDSIGSDFLDFQLKGISGLSPYTPEIIIGKGWLYQTDILTNISIRNITYPEVTAYQIGTCCPVDTNNMQTIYFVPRKGIVKIQMSPTHVWERIN